MIALNHVLAGTAIGLTVQQPTLAIPLALLSHFAMDALPHYDFGKLGTKKFLRSWLFDAVASSLALLFLILVAPEQLGLAILCALVAELPDVFWLYPNAERSPFWFFRFHKKIQWSETDRGIIYEILFAVALIGLNLWLLTK